MDHELEAALIAKKSPSSPLGPGRRFFSDVELELVGDSVCFRFERGESEVSDIAEIWLPLSAAVHAGAALLICGLGVDRAHRVRERLESEWGRTQGHLPEAQRTDFEGVVP